MALRRDGAQTRRVRLQSLAAAQFGCAPASPGFLCIKMCRKKQLESRGLGRHHRRSLDPKEAGPRVPAFTVSVNRRPAHGQTRLHPIPAWSISAQLPFAALLKICLLTARITAIAPAFCAAAAFPTPSTCRHYGSNQVCITPKGEPRGELWALHLCKRDDSSA
jgi:hypothetical protein